MTLMIEIFVTPSRMGLDLDKCLEKLRNCERLSEDELKILCRLVGAL